MIYKGKHFSFHVIKFLLLFLLSFSSLQSASHFRTVNFIRQSQHVHKVITDFRTLINLKFHLLQLKKKTKNTFHQCEHIRKTFWAKMRQTFKKPCLSGLPSYLAGQGTQQSTRGCWLTSTADLLRSSFWLMIKQPDKRWMLSPSVGCLFYIF